MATLAEILQDRTKYPDSTVYKVGDVETTLGELRGSVVPKADFTKELNRVQTERQQLEEQYRQQLAGMNYQLQQANQELARRGQPPQPTLDDAVEALQRDVGDPTLGPYAKMLGRMQRKLDETEKRMEQAEARARQHEETWWLDKHTQVANRIREQDDDFKDQTQMTRLLQYAQQQGIGNLDVAYRLMTRDRDIQRAKERAVQEYEAKQKEQQQVNANAPYIPSGARAVTTPPPSGTYTPPADSRDPVEDAKQAALSDPEIDKLWADVPAEWRGRP